MNNISGGDKAFIAIALIIAMGWTSCNVFERLSKADAYTACIARFTPEQCKWTAP